MNRMFFANIQPGILLFNRFDTVRCISSNGYGAIYLCKDTSNGSSLVAVKVLGHTDPSDKSKVDLLRREMLLASTIDHPNVVRSESFFQDENFSAFTMEYFNGGTLAEQIEKYHIFPVDFVIKTLSQLCWGLRAIHRAGIIHRDLKPENILTDACGNFKIADFSIAVSASRAEQSAESSLVGTMNYLSPEYIERGELDKRSDIYALGVIAYELVTGKLPFNKGSLLESLLSRVRFDPDAPHKLRKDCPVWLSDIIIKALQRDPRSRYESAQAMIEDLENQGRKNITQGTPRIDSGSVSQPLGAAFMRGAWVFG